MLRAGGRCAVMVYYKSWWSFYICSFLRTVSRRQFRHLRNLHNIAQSSTDGAIARFLHKASMGGDGSRPLRAKVALCVRIQERCCAVAIRQAQVIPRRLSARSCRENSHSQPARWGVPGCANAVVQNRVSCVSAGWRRLRCWLCAKNSSWAKSGPLLIAGANQLKVFLLIGRRVISALMLVFHDFWAQLRWPLRFYSIR